MLQTVWRVTGRLSGGKRKLLGLFLSDVKAESAARVAEGDLYCDVVISAFPANARLWTDIGKQAQAQVDAVIEVLPSPDQRLAKRTELRRARRQRKQAADAAAAEAAKPNYDEVQPDQPLSSPLHSYMPKPDTSGGR